jgi:hypothetical protein
MTGNRYQGKFMIKRRPITHQQLAAQLFEPVPDFINLNAKPTVREDHERRLEEIGAVSRIALHLLGKSKPELIPDLRAMGCVHAADDLFRSIVEGREAAQALVRLIESAETRVAVALANVIDPNWTVHSVAHR